jgi:hypothetical protein
MRIKSSEQIEVLAEELVDCFVATSLENGSGSTIADAWQYWESEWKEEEKKELREAVSDLLHRWFFPEHY